MSAVPDPVVPNPLTIDLTTINTPLAVVRHHLLTRVLHWGSALLLGGSFATALIRDALSERGVRDGVLGAHAAIGLTVILLTITRLLLRRPLAVQRVNAPALSSTPLRIASWCAHSALYALVIAVPLLGWTLLNAKGKPAFLFGLLQMPGLVARDRDLADTLEGWHGPLAWTLLALIAAHVLAALWHHFVRRDAVLASMLWRVTPRPASSSFDSGSRIDVDATLAPESPRIKTRSIA